MAVNFLESLISEWLEYKGLFVRTNVLVGPREKGGYECELDVVAIDVKQKKILQYEPTMDALSWKDREVRFKKKFEKSKGDVDENDENNHFTSLGNCSRKNLCLG